MINFIILIGKNPCKQENLKKNLFFGIKDFMLIIMISVKCKNFRFSKKCYLQTKVSAHKI